MIVWNAQGIAPDLNGIAPSHLICNVLTPASSVQIRESRRSDENLLYLPFVNYDLFKQAFEYRAPALRNSLPSYHRKAASVNDFKRLYRGTIF